VFILDCVWKIVVILPPGDDPATHRISTTNRVIVVKIPNDDTATNYWPSYVTSANQIQVDTGLTYFTALPPEVAAVLRGKVDGATNSPPAITTFTPIIGSAGTAVTITGTYFDGATAVAFNGASATFTIDSATQITATAPTNGSSGFVSVTTPSGTAISTNAFTFLTSGGVVVYSGILAGWDVSPLPGGLNNYGPSPYAPTTDAPHLSMVGLTRGSGVRTSGTAAAGGWGGTSFTNLTPEAAVASNLFITFSLTVSNGHKMSITALSRFDYYRSSTSPTNGVLQFQVGNGSFTDITDLYYPKASTGDSIGAIDLSGIAELQNVGANSNVTFRIANYGGTSSAGTWYIYNTESTPDPDLTLVGTIIQVLTATPPTITQPIFTGNQLEFTVTGTTGQNYILEATTNLAAPNWTPLITNAAPFTCIESNSFAFPERFYRGLIAP